MRPNRALCVLVAMILACPQLAAAAGLSQDNRSDQERRRAAERAERKAAEQTRDYQETMKEVAGELEEIGVALLQQRYDDPFLQDYINEMGQSLVPKETPAGTLFSFTVLDDPVPNAFALPDGRIYLNSGLLLFVENEAQLAVVLGHEIAHVLERHYVESVRTQKRENLVSGVLGAAAGAVLGGLFGGKKGAAEGAALGVAGGLVVAQLRLNHYNRKQEDESDLMGARLAMDRGYDPKQGSAFFTKLTQAFGDQGRFTNALYGRHSRNQERTAYIDQLLTGTLSSSYNELLSAGRLTIGTGQMHMYASRMTRDVAIRWMDDFDQYGVAKEHLERIADYRASDPRTLWALGRVYKRVGRTDQDRAKALDYFQRAARLDERNLYPYIHFDLGLMQARLGSTAAAVESLKKYVVGYVSRHYQYPPDLETTYDYLLTFGDRNWTAPAVDPSVVRAVRTAAPSPAPTSVAAPATKQPAKPVVPPKKPRGGRP